MSDEDDNKIVSVLLGLLDFDSDRATAHASFVIASIFGIYALLSAFKFFDSCIGKIVFGLTYILLVCLSFYSFLNFSKYASSAEKTREVMMNNYLIGARAEQIKKELRRRDKHEGIFKKIRDKLDDNAWIDRKVKVFSFAWLFAVSAPLIWIIFFQ